MGDRKSLFDGFYISGMVGGVKNAFLFLLPVEPGRTKSSTGIDI
jgi:hypothetical protein